MSSEPAPTLADYLQLNDAIYSSNPVSLIPSNYRALLSSDGNQVKIYTLDGLVAQAFIDINTNNVVVAFEGTQVEGAAIIGQINADADIIGGIRPAVFSEAEAFIKDVAAAAPAGANLYVTGHSLGGAIAQDIAATSPQIGGVTFGALAAAAIAGGTQNQNLLDYVDVNDPAYNINPSSYIGSVKYIDSIDMALTAEFEQSKILGLFASANAHLLNNYETILGAGLATAPQVNADAGLLLEGVGLTDRGTVGYEDLSGTETVGNSGLESSGDSISDTETDGGSNFQYDGYSLSSDPAAGGGSIVTVISPGGSSDAIIYTGSSGTGTAISSKIVIAVNDTEVAAFDTPEETATFASASGILKIETPSGFLGTISSFQVGDIIDLVGVAATSGTLTSNSLNIEEGSGETLTYSVSSSASPQTVYALPDGNGGTDLTLTEPVPVTTAPTLEVVTQGQVAGVSGLSVAVPGGAAANELITVALADGSGLLGASQVNGGTVTGSGTALLTLTGSLDAINAELATVTYTGTVANSSDLIDVRTTNDQGQGDDHQIGVQVDGPTTPPITLPIELPPGQTIPVSGLGGATLIPGATDNYVGQSVIDLGVIGTNPFAVFYSLDASKSQLTYGLEFVDSNNILTTPEVFYIDDVKRVLSSGSLTVSNPMPETVYQYQTQVGNTVNAHEYLIVTSNEVSLACFLSATSIATQHGDVPVDELEIGDLVQTHGGPMKPVKWIGHRRVDCRRHPKPQDVWPVRIMAGAFGTGLPQRDLWLSPDHAVFAEGVLIPIKYLINGSTIAQEARDEVTYWHVELAQHDVLLAEGLPCESYLDTGTRSSFANGGSLVQMHADFGGGTYCEAVWEGVACAPLRIEGPAVHRVAARLRRRAREMGFAETSRKRRLSAGRSVTATSDLMALVQPGWYLANHPDVAAAGVDATMHYVNNGSHEGRLPCSEIDMIRKLGLVEPGLIIFTMPDVVAAGVDPVEHFCTTGWRERRRPNPYFDTGWYLDSYEVPPGMNPLAYYVLFGEKLGHRPCKHFDPVWYAQRYALGASISALAHYLKHRRKQRVSPLPSFDVAAYRRVHAARMRRGCDPYAHFLAVGQFMTGGEAEAASMAA